MPLLLLGSGLLCQCSEKLPERPPEARSVTGAGEEESTLPSAASAQQAGSQDKRIAFTARELADLHLQWLSGKDLATLDRAFFRFALETPGKAGKPAQVLAQGSAWLSRDGKARIALRHGEGAVQLSFVSGAVVLRGPAQGPFAEAEEKEAVRIQELTRVMASLLGWDLLVPKIKLTLPTGTELGSEEPSAAGVSARRVVRGWKSQKDLGHKLATLKIDGADYRLQGQRPGLHGSLPERTELPKSKQTLHLETWLTKAEFKPGHLDPKSFQKQSAALVMGQEEENLRPTLKEYGETWEVALDDPGDWAGRFRILTQEVPQPFLDARLRPAGLPTLTDNGKMLIHVLPVDADVKRPKAPRGYRLQKRQSRVSAVVFVQCTWDKAPETLRGKLLPYIRKLGLRARGPLWMSPYLDWSSVKKVPAKDAKFQIRGEIRVQ